MYSGFNDGYRAPPYGYQEPPGGAPYETFPFGGPPSGRAPNAYEQSPVREDEEQYAPPPGPPPSQYQSCSEINNEFNYERSDEAFVPTFNSDYQSRSESDNHADERYEYRSRDHNRSPPHPSYSPQDKIYEPTFNNDYQRRSESDNLDADERYRYHSRDHNQSPPHPSYSPQDDFQRPHEEPYLTFNNDYQRRSESDKLDAEERYQYHCGNHNQSPPQPLSPSHEYNNHSRYEHSFPHEPPSSPSSSSSSSTSSSGSGHHFDYSRPPVSPPRSPSQNNHFETSIEAEKQYLSQPAPINSCYDSPGNGPSRPSSPPDDPQYFATGTDMTFQYSSCTGKKKALLIGINYVGSKNELNGCKNDVQNVSSFLNQQFQYHYDDMVILTDADSPSEAHMPTKENILRAMHWLVDDAQPNDSLVFHFSGHGGLTEDTQNEEESGFDDVIYPVDFEQNGHIVDTDMHDIMVRPLPPGCRLTALFDSCHSGTALDLPYVYSTKGVIKEPNFWKDAGEGAFEAFKDYKSGDLGKAISSLGGVAKRFMHRDDVDRDEVIRKKMSPADVVSISGCKDDETSADTKQNGQATGAMSWSFIKTLTEQPNQSFLSLLNNMRALLSEQYSQKPQLSSSHPQNMEIKFVM